MADPIVGKTPDGQPIYKDDKGLTYRLSSISSPSKPKVDEKAEAKLNKPKLDVSKLKEENNMVEDFVTKDELRKRDMETLRKELEAQIKAREDVDMDIKGKVQAVDSKVQDLDKKVCSGEQCYTRIEQNQIQMFKDLEQRLNKLDDPKFVCINCHSASIHKGDKSCPVCGAEVNVAWT
jgi:rubrerythrin